MECTCGATYLAQHKERIRGGAAHHVYTGPAFFLTRDEINEDES